MQFCYITLHYIDVTKLAYFRLFCYCKLSRIKIVCYLNCIMDWELGAGVLELPSFNKIVW